MSQLHLPGTNPPRQIRPSADRTAPVFWVRRLRVLRELTAGDEYVVRDVELRRGLNIVWAPPHESPEGNALFQNGVSGHTAGKSTFCRLVRYALGERGFAPEGTRRRLRQKLPNAWVLAEVIVEDATWVVARPLGIGPHSFCIRGADVWQATDRDTTRLAYQEFLDAISAATMGMLAAARFPASGEPVRWDQLLPWLSRDQECRFADFLEWRHSSSDSEAPALTVEERQFVVRSVLGLISDAERLEQQTNAQLVSERKNATQREPLFLHQARTDHARVSNALSTELPLPSTPLFGSRAHEELDRLRASLREREGGLAEGDRRSDLRNELEQAISVQTNARRDLEESEARLAMEQAGLAQLAGSNQSSLLAALPPPRDYCNVPMTLAHEQGCPLAVSRPIDLGARRSDRTAAQELDAQRHLVQALEAVAANHRAAVAGAEAATLAARRRFISAATAFDEQRGRLLEERARLTQVARLVQDAESAWRQASEQADAIARFAREIEESYGRQEQLRAERRDALVHFSHRFDYLVRAILGDQVLGRVDTAGRSLSLSVEEHGERDSAAIATVKLLAFDLAALTASVEGHGTFSRFLIHDGPREADLAPEVYERLFFYARELEQCFSGEPSFQYVLTTTTPPPDDFQASPWLRLKLAGVPTEERFLRCDL